MTTIEKISWLINHNYQVWENGKDSVIIDDLDVNGYRIKGPLEEIVNEAYEHLSQQ